MYFLGIHVIPRMTARLFHSRIPMCPRSMVDPCRRRRDTYHRSNDRGCVAPVTRSSGGNTDHHWSLYIVNATQSVPKIYSGAILVAYSTSSLANHAGTVVVVVVRRHPAHPGLFSNPRRAPTRDAIDTMLFPSSGPLLPSEPRLLRFCRCPYW